VFEQHNEEDIEKEQSRQKIESNIDETQKQRTTSRSYLEIQPSISG
jgi:hypothetical protein